MSIERWKLRLARAIACASRRHLGDSKKKVLISLLKRASPAIALLSLTAGVFLAGAWHYSYVHGYLPVSSDDEAFEQRLLKVGANETLFSDINPEPWATICYLPGNQPLSTALTLDGRGSKEINDIYRDVSPKSHQYGLAFFDIGKKKVKLVILKTTSEFYSIWGPRCIDREKAHFFVEPADIDGLDLHRIVFVERHS